MRTLLLLFFIGIFIVACNTSEQKRILEDKHFVEYLKKNGDKLIASREVFHWIYLKTDEEAEGFIREAEKENFIFVSKRKVEDDYPFEIQLKRVDKVGIKSVY